MTTDTWDSVIPPNNYPVSLLHLNIHVVNRVFHTRIFQGSLADVYCGPVRARRPGAPNRSNGKHLCAPDTVIRPVNGTWLTLRSCRSPSFAPPPAPRCGPRPQKVGAFGLLLRPLLLLWDRSGRFPPRPYPSSVDGCDHASRNVLRATINASTTMTEQKMTTTQSLRSAFFLLAVINMPEPMRSRQRSMRSIPTVRGYFAAIFPVAEGGRNMAVYSA